MTWIAFFLILASVLMHAGWNFLSKSRKPAMDFFVVFSLSLALTLMPLVWWGGIRIAELPGNVFGWAMCGGLCGAICDFGLSRAYSNADISLAYPVSRALPVILTTFLTAGFGWGSPLNFATVLGMGVVFCGCVLMPFPGWGRVRRSDYLNRGTFGILIAAGANTGYTIVDSFGIHAMLAAVPDASRLAGAATYSLIRELTALSCIVTLAVLNPRDRATLNWSLWFHPQPYCAGVFAALAYLLVLMAMGYVTNVSYVQAFRQLGLPVGVALGVWILKEKFTRWKCAALLLILGGLLWITLASR